MGKDKSEKSSKKDKKEKKEKRSDKEGVHKSKDRKRADTTLSPEKEEAVLAAISKVQEGGAANGEDISMIDGGDVTVKVNGDSVTLIGALVPFAQPLADEKGTKKILKTVKKAAKEKTLRRGVKEVVKTLRKLPANLTEGNAPGVVVLAADISPMDVISHIPVLCEEHNVPYVFVTSRAELGAAGSTKRPTSVVLVGKTAKGKDVDPEYKESYESMEKYVKKESRNVRF